MKARAKRSADRQPDRVLPGRVSVGGRAVQRQLDTSIRLTPMWRSSSRPPIAAQRYFFAKWTAAKVRAS